MEIKLFEINNVISPLNAIKKYVSKRNSKFAVTSASDPLFATDVYEALQAVLTKHTSKTI
jgi:hypothetical protein